MIDIMESLIANNEGGSRGSDWVGPGNWGSSLELHESVVGDERDKRAHVAPDDTISNAPLGILLAFSIP